MHEVRFQCFEVQLRLWQVSIQFLAVFLQLLPFSLQAIVEIGHFAHFYLEIAFFFLENLGVLLQLSAGLGEFLGVFEELGQVEV